MIRTFIFREKVVKKGLTNEAEVLAVQRALD
jgi:hypothetical protein